jgi:photosystem II stability/assembly factor-like uncharacterized protein
MKKINTLLVSFSLLMLTSCSFEKSENTIQAKKNTIKAVKYKKNKEKRNIDERYKKGIEHILEYEEQIRKPIDAKYSTYKKGYLQEEFKKAKQNLVFKKGANGINPVFIERGPTNVPGRTRGIAVDPKNNKRWFLGTAGGGVWLTENEGATWANLTDNQIAHLATTTIVISQQDSNILYVGTGEPLGARPATGLIGGGGLFKSTDGGLTWASLTTTISLGDVARIIINPADDNNVLIGTTTGIYRTINGGNSWAKVYAASNTVQDLDADPSNFNIQYGSINSFGLVKSINGGVTWTTVFDTTIFNANHVRFETAVSKVNPSFVVVCAFSFSGGTVSPNTDLYISRNAGASFTNLTAPNGTIVDRLDLVGGQGWYDNIVLTHPFNENIFYVGGVELFKVTVNNNNSFTALEIAATNQNSNLTRINTNVHVDQHGLFSILGTDNQFKILLANDGGLFSSNMGQDPGVFQGNWSNSVVGKNSTQFYGATKQNGQDNYIAGAQDNGTWISFGNNSNKTKSYQSIFGGDGFEVLWHYNKPGNFIGTSQFNNVARYIDNIGAISNFLDSGDSDVSPFYSKISNVDNNPDVVFSISSNGVWRSTDFGGNWSLSSISSNFVPNASSSLNVEPSIANPNIVWAGAVMTESGSFVLHVSQDNGQTFNPAGIYDNPNGNHNLFISGIGVSPTEEKRAYALFSSQGAAKILKTEDLGQTWTDISGFASQTQTGFPDVGVHSILEMPFDKNSIWVGTDIGIFETLDGGASWNVVEGFIPVAAYDMKIVNNQVIIATHGRGIWSATLSELDNYTLPAFLAPSEVTANQKEIKSLKTIISYNVSADVVNRVKIFIDDVEQTEVIQNFNTGVTYQYEMSDLSEGPHTVGVQLFDDTNNNQTTIQEYVFDIIDFENVSESIGVSEFKLSDVYIYNDGFKVDMMNNAVSGLVLNNSDHPYQDSKTYKTILKKPLVITEANKDFTYQDVAIVEPYTDDLNDLNSFYDFVIIEASTDLQTWKTIDKYDSRRFTEWLGEYLKGASASANDNLFKSQTIVLTDKGFSIGDTIVIRFSLVSDPAANSFGWAIKSIEGAVASIDEVVNDVKIFSVYPTISKGNFTVFGKSTLGKSKLKLFDITGKTMYSKDLNFRQNKKQEVSVHLNSGVYFIEIIGENNKRASTKLIIE